MVRKIRHSFILVVLLEVGNIFLHQFQAAKLAAEEKKKAEEEEERKKREDEERKKKEESERKKKEESEKVKREEEERKRKDEEHKKMVEEEDRKKKEEVNINYWLDEEFIIFAGTRMDWVIGRWWNMKIIGRKKKEEEVWEIIDWFE